MEETEQNIAPAEDKGAVQEETKQKSASQKKREKKKLKKVQQKEQGEEVENKDEGGTGDQNSEQTSEGGTKAQNKKNKPKNKKEEKKEEKRKGPSRALIEAKLAAIQKAKEEEERFLKEEEEKERLREEAEEAKREKERLEKEKKERKKQKEKEKKERLKAEGKLLTAKEKMKKQRALAMLESLKAQGIEVPEKGTEKKHRLGTRIRTKKNAPSSSADFNTSQPEAVVGATSVEEENEIEQEQQPPEPEPVPEEKVKDAWDEDSDDETGDTQDFVCLSKSSSGANGQKADVSDEISSHDDELAHEESPEDASEEEEESKGETKREKAEHRIHKRKLCNEKQRSLDKLRSPVVCVLGHVDTGKTKILDKLRRTHVQDGEAGGITQQIGATNVPIDAIKEQSKFVLNFEAESINIPGLLIIDTPGHESFSNLRSRGSSLCDIAILVIDIMHGLEPQTLESINLLKSRKTPFVVALNKIDRLYAWKSMPKRDVRDIIKAQAQNTRLEFEKRVKETIGQLQEQGLNAALFYENPDPKTYVSMVPTSATTGEGMGNLMALIVELSQQMLAKRLMFSEELQAIVLEVKAVPGLGTTIDVILINGTLREGETIVLAGTEGPIVTQIRSLLTPQPMKELRVKSTYIDYKEIKGAIGVKIAGKDLEKSIAGLNLLVAYNPDEVEICKEEVSKELKSALNAIKLQDRGVYVQASTLGSLEALLEFLKTSSIPFAGIRIGPVVKKDVMKASIMLEHDSQYAVILAFDVKIERDAQDLAENLGVRIFQADIIYHLFDKFTSYRDELLAKERDEYKSLAIFPCKLKIIPEFVFNTRNPIVVGVHIEAGSIKEGTPLCVPSRENLDIGRVTSIQKDHKDVDKATKGQDVCIKIELSPGDTPKLLGRHFEVTDLLVSKISRESIDICKKYFRSELQTSDWKLIVELKKTFDIL